VAVQQAGTQSQARNIKTLAPIFHPTYRSNESSYIKSEDSVGFAANFSTKWLPLICV
jgi:hypothetical protein